ncbi:hypothetical protein PROFUN_09068 [Planoprotostelium fungivorum]|uniref:Uncharacterized protein n=1 Tax=Planoprotostelium fungivorum TaxID=1890364 RepID=A0A2P6NIE7_9EUKA|nr:hypothetical protein PROFUN_09068 [Planoprotostelium fungivorum]
MSTLSIEYTIYCQHCESLRDGGRFCPQCGKSNEISHIEAPDKPERRKDVIHCTICHQPKAGHHCSRVPCLDPNLCLRPRLHKRQGNRGYHDNITFLALSNPGDGNGRAHTISTLISPSNPPPHLQSDPQPIIESHPSKRPRVDVELTRTDDQPPRPEDDRAKDFISNLAAWLMEYDESFSQSEEGRLAVLKIASNAHTQLQWAKRGMRRNRRHMDSVMDKDILDDVNVMHDG